MDEDEFIDDIPFPETQNYVKRILGTAEDYRHLYGDGVGRPAAKPAVAKKSAAVKKPVAKKPVAKKKTPPKKKRRR
jgi:soluble lytic murein transglycosylase